MGGILRYVIALAFAALFFLIPGADRDHLTFLETRSWLLQEGPDSPLWVPSESAGGVPPLVVDGVPSNREDDYVRLAREWARSNDRPLADVAPLRLSVDAHEDGFRATLVGPDGATAGTLSIGGDAERGFPGHLSLLPAFSAIVLAVLTGRIIASLLLGSLVGAVIYAGTLLGGLRHFVVDTLWQDVMTETFQLRIIGFVVFLFMTVGIMARSGGIEGMVEWVRRFARGPVSTQICSWIIGLLVFFDDYSNCIIVGTTMRPLADRNRVSREKLAYIVDSTAAPVAGLSIVSTWVAYEISTFARQLPEVTKRVVDAAGHVTLVPYQVSEGFSVFVQTLPYRFYCIFTLLMVALTIVLRREFGPMLRAERRAVRDGKPVADDAQPMLSRGFAELKAPPGAPVRGRNAFVPVTVLVVLAIGLMAWIGIDNTEGPLGDTLGAQLRTILENTASERALLWASAIALAVAATLAIGQRILTLREITSAAVRSASSLVFAVVILILAWCIGATCKDVGTAQFLTAAFHSRFEPWLLPTLMFLVSSLISFSTGTSYGTMAILLPNVVVLAHTMGETDPAIGGTGLMVLTIGAVLEGSIFGDHCSPISDTTVLSSVATASDHLHHVQTQAPYAVFVMLIAMVCGYVPMALVSRELWPLSWALGAAVMAGWLLIVGRRP